MLAIPARRLTHWSAGKAGPRIPAASHNQRTKATTGRYRGWNGSRVL